MNLCRLSSTSHSCVIIHATRSLSLLLRGLFATALLVLALAPLASSTTIDAKVSKDTTTASATISTPAFSTAAGNELLLAFISTDYQGGSNTTVTQLSGAGLTWVLVRRTNAQSGTAEIWRAFAAAPLSNVTVTATLSQSVVSSMTVLSFAGVDGSGTNGSGAIGATGSGNARSGAPTASLVTTRNGSWVFGVGNDYDRAVSRTPGTGQSVVHQDLAPVGDTYWVQMQNAPTATSGTTVAINDTAPTGDRYNLTIAEVLPAITGGTTFSVSGAVTPSAIGPATTITLSQSGTTVATTSANSSGAFSFPSVANGSYTVTPTNGTQTFSPASQDITVNGAAVAGVNFAAVTYPVTGTVSPSAVGSGTTLALSGAGTGTVTGDSSGNFTFNVVNGTYTITPSKAGYSFYPPNAALTVSGAGISGVNFTASPVTYSIGGSISPTASGVGALMTLSGAASATATASASASYSFTGLAPGTYTVTPSKNGFTFTPGSSTVSITTASLPSVNFTASAVAASTISGNVSPTSAGAGALVTLSPFGYAVADSSGNFSFTNLPAGTYSLTVTRSGYSFSPANLSVVINGTGSAGNNFTGTALTPLALNYPDLVDIIPPSAMSIVGTGTSRVFQYTHDTFEAGNGPLEIQPVYNAASGNYQGVQHIYSLNNGTWTVAQSIPVAGAFVFDPAHLHFHFPFVTYGLYASNPDGSIGSSIAASVKDGFCIDNSFIYDALLPNAGFGSWGSCSDPTTLRGLSIGAVDEYDQTDLGQAITIGTLADGTYWLRAIVDPNNYLAESEKSNNETDVQMQFTGNTVTVLQIVKPVLPPPPSISLTAPLSGVSVNGLVQLAASTPSSGGSGMQFLIDGVAFGSVVTTAPYTLNWDTTTTPNGAHWLAAQYTDSTGRIGTSQVANVTVANGGSSVPVVTVTGPTDGSTVSAVVIVAANVASANPIANVQFYADGAPIGAPVTSAPYSTFWNTESMSDGTHTITATATDTFGGVGNSSPVSVTVDNSHPANLIGIDNLVFTDGNGTMTSPAFTTTTSSDLLVAFVAIDGPLGSAQSATVSGGGLRWTLLKRSNTQAGDSEIWAAKAADFLTNATVIMQPSINSSYHGTLTVVAFTNAAGPGMVNQAAAPSGAPDIYIPGVSAGNWVFAVGNDWDKAVARTPVSGQYLVHQRVDTAVGDTYWVQATTAPSTATALVDIHDTAPTADRWNYCAVEVVATRQ